MFGEEDAGLLCADPYESDRDRQRLVRLLAACRNIDEFDIDVGFYSTIPQLPTILPSSIRTLTLRNCDAQETFDLIENLPLLENLTLRLALYVLAIDTLENTVHTLIYWITVTGVSHLRRLAAFPLVDFGPSNSLSPHSHQQSSTTSSRCSPLQERHFHRSRSGTKGRLPKDYKHSCRFREDCLMHSRASSSISRSRIFRELEEDALVRSSAPVLCGAVLTPSRAFSNRRPRKLLLVSESTNDVPTSTVTPAHGSPFSHSRAFQVDARSPFRSAPA